MNTEQSHVFCIIMYYIVLVHFPSFNQVKALFDLDHICNGDLGRQSAAHIQTVTQNEDTSKTIGSLKQLNKNKQQNTEL